ncbi:MAG: hypothetical protein IJ812_04505 [Schwartzia sp.]|nr:hypothetical protein [Schwartzia sp. (in: firmicutes)]
MLVLEIQSASKKLLPSHLLCATSQKEGGQKFAMQGSDGDSKIRIRSCQKSFQKFPIQKIAAAFLFIIYFSGYVRLFHVKHFFVFQIRFRAYKNRRAKCAAAVFAVISRCRTTS